MNITSKNLAVFWLASILMSGCVTLNAEPFHGQVLELGTNKPIAGAIVVGRWQRAISLVFDSRTECYHVETTSTDDQGHFQLPRWEGKEPNLIDSYKPGYERSDFRKGGVYRRADGKYVVTLNDKPNEPMVFSELKEAEALLGVNNRYLKPFSGRKGQRLEYLAKFSGMQCGERANYAKQLLPLYKQIYDEAKNIAVTKEEIRSASNRLRDLQEMEFGYDKAWENWRARAKTLE